MYSGSLSRPRSELLSAFCLCLILATTLGACGNSSPAPTDPNAISTHTLNELKRSLNAIGSGGLFNGSILVAQNGKVLLRQGYGYADHSNNSRNQPQTKFRIASLTEQFTAMSILLLQQQGKLHVEDKACTYLSSCPTTWQPITIKQLLTSTSGIPSYQKLPSSFDDREKPATPDQLLARFSSAPLDFTPGSGISFSESNYLALGDIIEKLSGQSYADFVQQNILDPLKLTHSGYDQNNPPSPEHAIGYANENYAPISPVDISVLYSAGALYSTIDDLYTWDQALFNHKFSTSSVVDQMFAKQVDICAFYHCGSNSRFGRTSIGYAWYTSEDPQTKRQAIRFSGTIPGFSASNTYYPKEKITVIVLSNQTNGVSSMSNGSLIDSILFPDPNS